MVSKESLLWHYRRQKAKLDRLPAGYLRRLEAGEKRHNETLAEVKRALEAAGLKLAVVKRNRVCRGGNYDLAVTVGGDGTLIRTAHCQPDVPLLGVNSDSDGSVGYLCRASSADFAFKLGKLLKGNHFLHRLTRLRLRLDGKQLFEYALNDILVTNEVPAFQSRYLLKLSGKSEMQRSSGLWVATAVGSSAVISSAGGKRLAFSSSAVQYVVREPCRLRGGYRLLRGELARGGKLSVDSLMVRGRIYVDGAGCCYPFPVGSKLVVDRAKLPLKLVDF